jgi:hypothetical protein
MKRLLAALLVGTALISPATAASYFLDNSTASGLDSNAGTNSNAPWATLMKASMTMVAGDVLYVASTHSEPLMFETATVSGSTGSGDTAAVTFTGSFAGSPHTTTYSEIGGDTTTTTATGLKNAINADATMLAAHCYSTSSAAIVTIECPTGTTYSGASSVTTVVTMAAGTPSFTFAGTAANPNQIFSVVNTSWSGGGYTPVSADLTDPSGTTATFTTAQSSAKLIGSFYMTGPVFASTVTSASAWQTATVAGNTQVFNKTEFTSSGTSSPIYLAATASTNASVTLQDSIVKFGSATSSVFIGGTVVIRGSGLGSFLASGSTLPTNLFTFPATGNMPPMLTDGVDLSAETNNLFQHNGSSILARVINSKLGTTSYIDATPTVANSTQVRIENSDSAATNYALHWREFSGSADTDTSNFETGGATYDGTHGYSFELTGTGNATVSSPQRSPYLMKAHLNSGVSETVTVQFMFDGANNAQGFNAAQITNKQAWLRCGWSGSAASPLDSFSTLRVADLLPSTASANQATSTAGWTSPSVTTVEKGRFQLTFTPQIAGYYECWIEDAIASGQILWVDPTVTVSP